MENNKPLGLYIHIPFCEAKCDYCDFVSYAMDEQAQRDYLHALCIEIDKCKADFNDKVFNTIFIGGGTPSIVFNGFIKELSKKIFSSFCFEKSPEFTIEINPSSFTTEKLIEYVSAGVNRISVGVQCLDEHLLAMHGRVQSNEAVKETFRILKNNKFKNVNADIMIGLPGQTEASVMETLNFLIAHNVKHISAYTLQVEKYTMLYNKLKQGTIKEMPEDKVLALYEKIAQMLKQKGFKRYEISNYARPCFESEHNKKYWDGTNYLGLGVSAHSYLDNYRIANTRRLDNYIDSMFEGGSAVYSRDYVTQDERKTERIMLSLRTSQGLNLEDFKQEFGEDIMKTKSAEIKQLLELEMLKEEKGFLKIPAEKMSVSNAIIVELL